MKSAGRGEDARRLARLRALQIQRSVRILRQRPHFGDGTRNKSEPLDEKALVDLIGEESPQLGRHALSPALFHFSSYVISLNKPIYSYFLGEKSSESSLWFSWIIRFLPGLAFSFFQLQGPRSSLLSLPGR